MELYTLDTMLRRTRVIDQFTSLIWTERWQSLGDFELVIDSTSEYRKYLQPGTWLSLDESYRCMIVKTIEDSVDDEGKKVLTVKGVSIESLFEERVARTSAVDLTTTDLLTITDQPQDIMTSLFSSVCVTGSISTDDIIPYQTTSPIFPTDGIAFPSGLVTISFDVMSLYDAFTQVAEPYDLGFRLCRNPDTNLLKFDVYTGTDRTTSQSTYDPVIFSPEFDNLRSTSELTTTAGSKNVAYVFSPVGFEIVFAPGVDVDVDGFERKVLAIRADDITDSVPADATAKMIQRGLEELAKLRDFSAFDGEIDQNTQYKYDSDYYLGDIIEMRSEDGTGTHMRVTEQIHVADENGQRSYPTFVAINVISPDTWLGWPNTVWFDYDASSLHWGDL